MMKANSLTCNGQRSALFRLLAPVVVATSICLSGAAQSAPQVHLDANGLAPRPIEELTATTITRHYGLAWNELALALESNRSNRLSEEFVGTAKDRLARRVVEQSRSGIHVRIVDHGHQLRAVFYSTDGTVMQLVDRAQLEIQTFDGSRLLDATSSPHDYLVLMTPGADRWYVRNLEEISVTSF